MTSANKSFCLNRVLVRHVQHSSHKHTSQIFSCHEDFKCVTISGLSLLWFWHDAAITSFWNKGVLGMVRSGLVLVLKSQLASYHLLLEENCFLLLYITSGLLKALKDTSIAWSLKSQKCCVPVSLVIFSFLFSAHWCVYLTLGVWLVGWLLFVLGQTITNSSTSAAATFPETFESISRFFIQYWWVSLICAMILTGKIEFAKVQQNSWCLLELHTIEFLSHCFINKGPSVFLFHALFVFNVLSNHSVVSSMTLRFR